MTKYPVIYAVRNTVNGKSYIGSTNDLYYRKALHLSQLRRGVHHSVILQRAFNKYGERSFDFIVLEHVKDYSQILLGAGKFYQSDMIIAESYGYVSKIFATESKNFIT
jgi:group I intron endonuclease